MQATRRLLSILGPGVLMAAACIGTSHLVQSTQAGARFGFQLLWLALAINIVKYPFFEFGQRYGASTGQTLLHGYQRLGRLYLLVYMLLSMVTMITSITALAFVTGALADNLARTFLAIDLGAHSLTWWAAIMLALCLAILATGQYATLDRVTKVTIAILGLTVIIATVIAFMNRAPYAPTFEPATPWTLVSLPFVIAFMGWMPGPVELSAWPSVWMKERQEQTGKRVTVREALIDFNVGYGAAIVLAIAFLSLGALVMYPRGETFSPKGVEFASQLVGLFRDSIGTWSGPIVAIAAFTTIFSTTLTVLDGYPRTNSIGWQLFIGFDKRHVSRLYWIMSLGSSLTAILFARFFISSLTHVVNIAMTVAFLAAPLIAILNLWLIRSKHTPPRDQPRTWMIGLACVGVIFLTAFGFIYLLHLAGAFTPAIG